MNRREFLIGSSAIVTLSFCASRIHAGINNPGGASSGGGSNFNGGLSQGQSTAPNVSGDFPFLNLTKQASSWLGTDTFNSGNPVSPLWLGSDGYPLAAQLQANSVSGQGVALAIQLPPQASFTSNIQLLWDVTGAGSSDVVQLGIGLMGTTPVSGSLSSTGNGTNFSYVFTPLYNTGHSFNLNVKSLGGTAHLQNLRVTFTGTWATLLAQGKFFNPQFLSQLQTAGFGVYRFMDWLNTNGSNATLWATRKSLGYVTWSDPEWRATLLGGETTNSSNDYSLTTLGSYVWPGFSSAPVDKQVMHVQFNATATLVQNNVTGGNPGGGTLTINSLSPLTFGWTSHPLSNGDIVAVSTAFTGGNPMDNTDKGNNLYVVNAAANTFQVARTSGGTAVTVANSGGGNICVTKMPTLNLNGNGKVPIRAAGAVPFFITGDLPTATINAGSVVLYGTIVYDADLNTWMMHGGSNNQFSRGLDTQVPPEICFELCKEIGAHPHWAIPGYALDAPTDYAKSLATYCQSNNPGWMIPHYEPGNEVWNFLTPITNFADGKSFAHWGSSGQNEINDWYSMSLSIMGQGVASIYGLGNLGTKYEVLCGVQTDGGLGLQHNVADNRLTAPLYVSLGPSRAGYTQSSAVGWTSAVLVATYVSPAMRGAIAELQNAWGYYVTNVGNATAQLANLNAFIDTLNTAATGTATFSNGVANINWTTGNLLGSGFGSQVVQFSGGTLPSNIPASTNLYVSSVSGNNFQVSAFNGSVITPNANGTSTVTYAPYSFTNFYEAFRYQGFKTWATGLGVSKMFAYEGGYSPDLPLGGDWSSQITAATKANPCVLTVTNTNSNDGGNIIGVGSNQAGTPAEIGMCLFANSVTGMTQLNCSNSDSLGSVTLTAGSAVIPLASNPMIAGQGIVFRVGNLPPNITAGTTYFVLAAGLSGSQFEISATSGGSAITIGGTGSYTAGWDSGWVVTNVAGTSVTIAVDSTAFGVFSNGFVNYLGSHNMISNFRIAALLSGTDLGPTGSNMTKVNYNNFTAAGGLFPSQYQFAGTGSVWFIVQPDIWGTDSQEFLAIQNYNGH